jgi:hypothetical protein
MLSMARSQLMRSSDELPDGAEQAWGQHACWRNKPETASRLVVRGGNPRRRSQRAPRCPRPRAAWRWRGWCDARRWWRWSQPPDLQQRDRRSARPATGCLATIGGSVISSFDVGDRDHRLTVVGRDLEPVGRRRRPPTRAGVRIRTLVMPGALRPHAPTVSVPTPPGGITDVCVIRCADAHFCSALSRSPFPNRDRQPQPQDARGGTDAPSTWRSRGLFGADWVMTRPRLVDLRVRVEAGVFRLCQSYVARALDRFATTYEELRVVSA